jgi:hypothetical protein
MGPSSNAVQRDATDVDRDADFSPDPFLPDSAQLAALGAISEGYRHHTKEVRPRAGLAVPGAYLKWYDIHVAERPITSATRDAARDFLRSEATSGRLELRDELGFVLLHHCGEAFHLLVVCTWRAANELWQTIYQRDGDGPFELFPHGGQPHRGTQRVWELCATAHERLAWSRYLCSERDETAKRDYLADVFAGEA